MWHHFRFHLNCNITKYHNTTGGSGFLPMQSTFSARYQIKNFPQSFDVTTKLYKCKYNCTTCHMSIIFFSTTKLILSSFLVRLDTPIKIWVKKFIMKLYYPSIIFIQLSRGLSLKQTNWCWKYGFLFFWYRLYHSFRLNFW